MFVLSAAGFIATRTSGWSPGVWMSVDEKLIWKPRHAGQRAGRRADLGREVGQRADVVAEDGGGPGELGAGELHAVAGIAGEADGDSLELLESGSGALVSRHAPSGSFMRWCGRGGRLSSSSGKDSARYLMMSDWRTTPTRCPSRIDERDVAVAAGLHQLDRVADRLVEVERVRLGRHQRSTGWLRSTSPPTIRAKMSRSVRTPMRRPSGSHTKTESPVPVRWMARTQSARRRARRDGHGLPSAEDAQALLGERGDATDDGGFGEFAHGVKCSPSPPSMSLGASRGQRGLLASGGWTRIG